MLDDVNEITSPSMCDLLETKGKRRVSRSKKTSSSLKKERNLELDEILGKENAKKKRNVGQDLNYIFFVANDL